MYMPLVKKIAESRRLMELSILSVVVSVIGVTHHRLKLDEIDIKKDGVDDSDFTIPDLRFGYTEYELNNWYSAIGTEGCDAYKEVARWDFCPMMVSYTILLGALLVKAANNLGDSMSPKIAAIAPIMTFFDIIETGVQMNGCHIFPEKLPTAVIGMGSKACQMKWIFMGLIVAFLVPSLLVPVTVTKKPEKPVNPKKLMKSKVY